MNKKVLLLHGWGGSDYPHWQSWLAGELAKDYGCVNFLKFSDPDTPKLDIWLKEATEALEDFQPDIVVCHSLANILWFHLCNTQAMKPLKQLYLVAPPRLNCEIKELEEFFPVKTPKDLYSNNSLLIYSTNDPYMNSDEAADLHKQLNIPAYIVEDGGHINASSGFGEWNWILQEIKKILSTI